MCVFPFVTYLWLVDAVILLGSHWSDYVLLQNLYLGQAGARIYSKSVHKLRRRSTVQQHLLSETSLLHPLFPALNI